MTGSNIIKEGEKVDRIRRAIAKVKNDSNCREIYFKPGNIEERRFKIHEPCNRCVYVIVSIDTTFTTKTRIKVIVEDLERVK